jgi:hypothetical protein
VALVLPVISLVKYYTGAVAVVVAHTLTMPAEALAESVVVAAEVLTMYPTGAQE